MSKKKKLDEFETWRKHVLESAALAFQDNANDRIIFEVKTESGTYTESWSEEDFHRYLRDHDRSIRRWVQWQSLDKTLTPKTSDALLESPLQAKRFLHWIMPSTDAETLTGDFEEKYHKWVDEFGQKEANRLYWKEVLRSTIPIFVRELRKLLGLIEWIKSLLG